MSKILLVSGSEKARDSIGNLLKNFTNSMQITTFQSGSEVRQSKIDFDVVIINTPLSDEFGKDLATYLSEKTDSGIILICKIELLGSVSEQLEPYGICVVENPLNKNVFFKSLKLVFAMRSRILGLRQENKQLQNKIDEIRIINRAKMALMQYLGYTEPQAHRYIEKHAMDTRQSKYEVAKNLLRQYEN